MAMDLSQNLAAAKARLHKAEAAAQQHRQTYDANLPTAADAKIAQLMTGLEDAERNVSMERDRIAALENAIAERDEAEAAARDEANWQQALEVIAEVERHGRRLEAQLSEAGKTLNALFADVASLPRLITVEGRSASEAHQKIAHGVVHSVIRSGVAAWAIPNSGDLRPKDMGILASINEVRRLVTEQRETP